MKAPAAPGSSAIIGEPWETKIEGRVVFMASLQHRARAGRSKRLHAAFDALAIWS